MARAAFIILTASLVSVSASSTADARSREIDGERVLLGQLVDGLPGDLARVDLGPAPQPGHARIWTRRQLKQRLRQAMVDTGHVTLPRRVRIVRRKQVLTEVTLKHLVAAAIAEALPAGATLREVRLVGGIILPRGRINVDVDVPRALRNGRQLMRLRIAAGVAPARTLVVTAHIAKADPRTLRVIARGDRIMITARTGGVTVRSQGVAQQAGAPGDRIAVLAASSNRVVHARVVDASNVEVDL